MSSLEDLEFNLGVGNRWSIVEPGLVYNSNSLVGGAALCARRGGKLKSLELRDIIRWHRKNITTYFSNARFEKSSFLKVV